MRAFIAIDLPIEIRKKIKQIQKKLPEFIGKKTEINNLHLTLKFLGEIDKKKLTEIKKRLDEIKFNKFETEIDIVGVFSEEFIKIVWLHMTNCEELQKLIDEKLSGLFPKEERFMSHLTIGRVKYVKDKKSFLEKIRKIKIDEIKFVVNSFVLKKSLLTTNGPVYENLLEVK